MHSEETRLRDSPKCVKLGSRIDTSRSAQSALIAWNRELVFPVGEYAAVFSGPVGRTPSNAVAVGGFNFRMVRHPDTVHLPK
jgi:hypothetical protein